MDSNQHDHDADTGSSRPDDPAVVARESGKTTRESSSENPRPHQPPQRHNRGPPPDDDDQWDERLIGGDLLVGADRIRTFLVYLGMPADVDIYYLRRCGRWPIGNTGNTGGGGGGRLIASKRRLIHHVEKFTRGPAA